MIIDAHAHYTTTPPGVRAYCGLQISQLGAPAKGRMSVSDDEIRMSLEQAQIPLLRERGVDLVLFSPEASQMGHHFGSALISRYWTEHCNDLIARVCQLYPEYFVGVCQLPQSPGVSPANCIAELDRCINELGFVACNLNPDPTGGYWTDPPLTNRYWYPLFEKLVELNVPAMIHASASCNPNFQLTGGHYIAADTTVFMQFLETPQLFRDFPTLRFVIPHGGRGDPVPLGTIPRDGACAGPRRTEGTATRERLLRHLCLLPAWHGAPRARGRS